MREVNSLAKELKGVFHWHQARVTLLAQFMLALVNVRSTNLTLIAQFFYGTAQPSSNYKRLQRFLRHVDIDYDVYASIVAKWFCPEGKWVLSLDRTNWEFGVLKINFLVLAVAHEGIAIPIFWRLLPKKGNSNTQERMDLLHRFIQTFGSEKIAYLTADREFRGGDWLRYLVASHIPFCLRIPNNTKVWNKYKNRKMSVSRLFSLSQGETMHIHHMRDIWGVPVYLSCIRGNKGRVIIASDTEPKNAINNYRVRWSIETLFGCLKTRGFDLEKTHLIHLERLEKLFMVLSLTFSWCFKIGIWQNSIKAIPLKTHGRRSKSLFRYGLDCLHRALINIKTECDAFFYMLKVLSCT